MQVDWSEAVKPLLKKYKNAKHPLEFQNRYQLMVMVVLAAQTTDAIINKIAPAFFKKYPNLSSLSKVSPKSLAPLVKGVRNFANKSNWLIEIAQKLKTDDNIPKTHAELTALPGIGSKSANVILRESGFPPEGVIVDLHVVRVAPRLGIAEGDDPKKIEKQIMEKLPKKQWDAGMAMSFLGREICRPTDPRCEICVMRSVCSYYKELIGK